MKWFLKIFALVLSTFLISCSSMDFTDSDLMYEYESEWAAAYFLGEAESSSSYRLVLTAGRTDDKENLISGGAVLTLMLNAPLTGERLLPDGKYEAAQTKGSAYTFNYGMVLDGDAVDGSYVMAKLPGAKDTKLFPVDGGEVIVDVDEDGAYEVRAELSAAGCSFGFEYEGRIRTFNLDM